MAYQDALFQLGMDLTRSSTAQEEDRGETACVARVVAPKSDVTLPRQVAEVGRLQDRVGSGLAGSHLVIDLFGAIRLDDADHVELTLRRCADEAGVIVRHVHLNAGAHSDGVSAFAAIDGGHISIHTHALTGCAALDVYVRGEIGSAGVVKVLEKAFSASRVVVRQHTRGDERKALAQVASVMRGGQPRSRVKVRKAA
jgi:S-adenosylmethionine decarboxylase